MKKVLLLLIVLFLFAGVNGQSLVINEFMAKNDNTIQDEDGDYSDWIELFNVGDITINLLDFSLSDDVNDLNKWDFPDINILPHSFLLVFASDKNKVNTELHTNFKISSGGEALFLSDNSGLIIDQTIPIDLSGDESYCRIPDGNSSWIITDIPTPNATNIKSNKLVFSDQQGFYSAPFSLYISSVLGDTIYYTLNGDIPTKSSDIFPDSILINDRSTQPNILSEIPTSPEQGLISYKAWEAPGGLIDKATVLRCASYRNGHRTSKVYTRTFFVDNEIFKKYTLPVISLVTEKDNLFNADSGIFVPGVNYDENNPEWTGNYFMRGDNWERDVHIEYFDKDGGLGFSQDAGIRIHGGKTRQASQKSLRLYAREEYGEKYFNYSLLPQRGVSKYKRFLLRTTMGSWEDQSVLKDALTQQIAATLDVDYQEFQPVIVFVNGEYWGVHTIRDRIDERYIEYIHNIDRDLVEFMEENPTPYENLMEFIENNSLEFSSNYEYLNTQIDIDNYIDYTIAEFFFQNYDWPANNVRLWREIPDGKWRWVLYDLDAGLGDVYYDMFLHATKNDPSVSWPNSPSSTFLFRSLLQNETFSLQFINRFAEVLNNDFAFEIMARKLDSIKEIYSPEIPAHIDRWNYPDSFNDWEFDIDQSLLSFINDRPCVIREQIMTFFGLTSFGFVCDSQYNTIYKGGQLILAPNPNRGRFFLSNNHSDISGATILICSSDGSLIHEEIQVDIKKNERKYFDLSSYARGVYVLHIMSNNYSTQKKIILSD